MIDLSRAELAMGEVLVFEVAIERFFGFQDGAMAAAGQGAGASVAAPIANAVLVSSGQAGTTLAAASRASALLQSIGAAIAAFEGKAVLKISGDFAMAGTCSWYARGVTFKPVMPLNDGHLDRPPEYRGVARPREFRGAVVQPAGAETRYQENRGMTR